MIVLVAKQAFTGNTGFQNIFRLYLSFLYADEYKSLSIERGEKKGCLCI